VKARHWAALCLLLLVGLALLASGCTGNVGGEPLGWTEQAVTAPKSAQCKIDVLGTGVVDMETNYIPRVITCEDGGAGLQALEAQAIAARSVAYYAIATDGHICDGQGCQVYSCGQEASDLAKKAAAATAGMVLGYDGTLTYGFFVAGDPNASPPGCRDYGGSTSGDVTYNRGLSGTHVHQTPLGYEGSPGNGQNRGCMSQDGARCLENHEGYNELQILRFYYGSDIQVIQTRGACVPQAETLKATAVRKWSNAKRYHGKAADYLACAGDKLKMSFTFKNVGTAEWRDVSGRGKSIGSDVFLVTASGKKDRITGHKHYSIRLDKNSHVRGDRNAKNCSNRNGCRKTTFIAGAMSGRAPKKAGIYKSRWRLRDFSKAWGNKSHGFGPKVQIKLKVVDCSVPQGTCGCRVWCNDGKSHRLSSSIKTNAQCKSAAKQYCHANDGASSIFITDFKACPVSGSGGASGGGASGSGGSASGSGGSASGSGGSASGSGGSASGSGGSASGSGGSASGSGGSASGSGGGPFSGNGGAAGAQGFGGASGAAPSFDPGSEDDPNGIDTNQSGAGAQDDPGYSDDGFHGDDQAADKVPDSGCSVAAGAGGSSGAPLEGGALMLLLAFAEIRRRSRREMEVRR
jgi:Stage II sporulation protein